MQIIYKIWQQKNFRITYVFGTTVDYAIHDVTPTLLNTQVISLIQQVDDIVHETFAEQGLVQKISQVPTLLHLFYMKKPIFIPFYSNFNIFKTLYSLFHCRKIMWCTWVFSKKYWFQLPVVLIPIHFDRQPFSTDHPSVLYAVCLRPFITNDFMTGVAAIPGVHLPSNVYSLEIYQFPCLKWTIFFS